MQKEQKRDLIRIALYSASSLIVGVAVGGTLLMKAAVSPASAGNGDSSALDSLETVLAEITETTQVTTTVTETTTTTTTTTTPPPPTVDSLRVALRPAEDLFYMTYYYSDSDSYETHSEAFGWRVPFTTESVILTYEGKISIGIDMDAIIYNIDPDYRQITVLLPEPELIAHELDEQSIQYYDVKSSIFRSSSLSDYTSMIRGMKDKIYRKVMAKHNFNEQTLEQAQKLITACLINSKAAQDYTIRFDVPVLTPITTEAPVTTTTTTTTTAPVTTAAPATRTYTEPENDPFWFWW